MQLSGCSNSDEWKEVLRGATGGLAVMGDALGVLHGAQKSEANDVVLNWIMAEAALILAPMGRIFVRSTCGPSVT